MSHISYGSIELPLSFPVNSTEEVSTRGDPSAWVGAGPHALKLEVRTPGPFVAINCHTQLQISPTEEKQTEALSIVHCIGPLLLNAEQASCYAAAGSQLDSNCTSKLRESEAVKNISGRGRQPIQIHQRWYLHMSQFTFMSLNGHVSQQWPMKPFAFTDFTIIFLSPSFNVPATDLCQFHQS